MQVLLLQLGGQQYALETRRVVRVLPALRLTCLPRAPAFIAGIMNYQGASVPVLDLTLIGSVAGVEAMTEPAIGQADPGPTIAAMPPASAAVVSDAPPAGRIADAAGAWFDTRIILVMQQQADGGERLLGLRAEHVTGTRVIDPAQLTDSGVHDAGSPFLGRVIAGELPMRQLIDLAQLLPPHVTRWLAGRMAELPC